MQDKYWKELYFYVKKEILNYDDEIGLPKFAVLRLKGLTNGKFMANKKTDNNGKYTFKEILIVFKLLKGKIKSYLSDDTKFKDEQHRINGVIYIVEKEMNEIILKLRKNIQQQENVNRVEVSDKEVEYVKRDDVGVKNKLKNLW